jgi:predicted RNase H-like nuclease
MRFLGVDLAWADAARVNETGVVALDPDGRIAAAGWALGVDDTVRWVEAHAAADTIVAVDAPLLVLNAGGQRVCENEVGRRYGRFKVSANSSNLASPRAAGVRLRRELEARGWRYADGTAGPPAGGRTLFECYPYTTLVGAAELGYAIERPLYKRRPRRLPIAEWRPLRAAACDELVRRVAALAAASPPLDLRSHPVTAALATEPSPLADRAYKHREDLVDACLAAWTASLWASAGTARCQVLGAGDPLVDADGRRATIIAPARPEQRGGATRLTPA